MGKKVYIDGAIGDPEDALVSVFDRGFLYGDSVYEALRTSGGRPVDLDAHLLRLHHSANFLDLTLPGDDTIRAAIEDTLAAAGNAESHVRLIVTRGAGEMGLDIELADKPTLIVIVRPLVVLPAPSYTDGVTLRVVGVQRVAKRAVDPSVKSGNYLNNIMALREARGFGAHEAVMCDAQGRIAECSTSNIFIVRGGEVATPSLDIGLLPGITRMRVMQLAKESGIQVRETTLLPADLHAADEVFITSSIRSVVPVCQVDDQALAAPGPMTARLMALYAAFLEDVARGG